MALWLLECMPSDCARRRAAGTWQSGEATAKQASEAYDTEFMLRAPRTCDTHTGQTASSYIIDVRCSTTGGATVVCMLI
jgi:hypothetical protein